MAVRINAAADNLNRSVSDIDTTDFTIMMWVYLVSDRNDYGDLFDFNDGGTFLLVYVGADGTTLTLYDNSAENTGTSLSTATWYHVALVGGGSGTTLYLDGVSDATGASTNVSSGTLNLGSGTDGWIDARLAHVKIYDAQLTAAEVVNEMRSITPVRLANINSWYPTFPNSTERAADYGGSGRNFTEGGTLTDEIGPGIAWGPIQQQHYYLVPAAAGASAYMTTNTGYWGAP